MVAPYNLSVVQFAIRPVFDGSGPFLPDALGANIDHTREIVLQAVRESESRLVLFPEFWLQGYVANRTVADWVTAGIRVPGPETERIGAIARESGAYVAGMIYERIDAFPGRYFNSMIVVAPSGDVVLTYRKHYSMIPKTRPGDVFDEWVARYGIDSLFPVAETPLGRLGALVGSESDIPEVPRMLAMQGAEVLLNAVGEGRSVEPADFTPSNGGDYIRHVRAHENLVYFAMSNIGPFLDGSTAPQPRVPAEILDYTGTVLARATSSAEQIVTAEIDIEALRRRRQQAQRQFLAELQAQVHAPFYARAALWPNNSFANTPVQDLSDNRAVEREVIARLTRDGILVAPSE